MRTIERKLRGTVVIETPEIPSRGVVALGTVIAQPSRMRIVLGVTGTTGGIGLAVGLVSMAALAGNRRMHAEQRKRTQAVIEPDFTRPGRFLMAPLTLLALGTTMNVIILVAAQALGGGGVLADLRRVAALACGIRVCPAQRKISILCMVET